VLDGPVTRPETPLAVENGVGKLTAPEKGAPNVSMGKRDWRTPIPLQDVKLRKPDILFDREVKLDLGGVTARLFWLGAAHTEGDELIFVEEDSVLLPGDIV